MKYFKKDSCGKQDWTLLQSTVKIHAALTGWKATLKGQCYIRCSCFKKPDHMKGSMWIPQTSKEDGNGL